MNNINKKIKRIPYGIADFEAVMGENYCYVDKTGHIPLIEDIGRYLFLIRPRRFGKSLWLSVLESYYDIAKKDRFDEIFTGTAIHEDPTEERNSYLILTFNFSLVNPNIDMVEESFETYTEGEFSAFIRKYRDFFDNSFIKETLILKRTADRLNRLFRYISQNRLKLYILIDEYDNFANTILSTIGQERYRAITHGEGFYRYFFNILKGGTTGSGAGLARLFITGVSPLTMDDVTSGFNIGDNISMEREINELLGFTEEEVIRILKYYKDKGKIKEEIDHHLEIMDKWYNNYRFTKDTGKRIYNTDMVLYYINNLISGEIPTDLIDQNVKTDYKKLRHLIILDRQLNGNFSRLKEIIENEEIQTNINISFPAEELLNPENFLSLLYYFGLLTHDRIEKGSPYLKIPNITIKKLIYEYIREAYKEVDIFRISVWKIAELMRKMAYQGRWEEVFDHLSGEIERQTSIRDYLTGEKVIQGFLLAYINITDHFIISTEHELGKGFVDLYFEPFLAKYPDMRYSYLIELKYIKREAYTEKLLKEKIKEAEEQLERYSRDRRVTDTTGGTELKKVVIVFSGWEMVYRGVGERQKGQRQKAEGRREREE